MCRKRIISNLVLKIWDREGERERGRRKGEEGGGRGKKRVR